MNAKWKKFVGAGTALALFFFLSVIGALPTLWEKDAAVYAAVVVLGLSLVGGGGCLVLQMAGRPIAGSFWSMSTFCGVAYVIAAAGVAMLWSGGTALKPWMVVARINSVAAVLYSGIGLTLLLWLAFTSRASRR